MIPVFRPSYDEKEYKALKGVLKSGWIGLGPKTQEFEEAFAAYSGAKYAVGTNSCSAALQLALHVLDLPPGSEVITTSLTFVSTNHAILHNNLTPVFCDIEADTLNIDAGKIERLITKKTKAIMCVHYGGHACDMARLKKIAKKHSLYLIEDCAHAAGAEFRGRKLGTFGDMGCFSFHAVKNLAMGQGGAILTNNEKWEKRLKRLRWVGISKDTWSRADHNRHYSWYYNVDELGYLYHMFDITATLGLVQLKKLDRLNTKRRAIAAKYTKAFAKTPGITPLVQRAYALSSQHNYVIKTNNRDALMDHLAAKGIATSVHYYPNHLYPMYQPYARSLPITDTIWQELVTLPLFPDLTLSQVKHIISSVNAWAQQHQQQK